MRLGCSRFIVRLMRAVWVMLIVVGVPAQAADSTGDHMHGVTPKAATAKRVKAAAKGAPKTLQRENQKALSERAVNKKAAKANALDTAQRKNQEPALKQQADKQTLKRKRLSREGSSSQAHSSASASVAKARKNASSARQAVSAGEREPQGDTTDAVDDSQPPSVPNINRGGSLLQRAVAAPPPAPSAVYRHLQQAAVNVSAAVEPGQLLLVSATMSAAKTAASHLRQYQLQVKSRRRLQPLGLVISVFRVPPSVNLGELLHTIQADWPDLIIDVNRRYRLEGRARHYIHATLQWPAKPALDCLPALRVGMLDTAIMLEHPALQKAHIRVKNFTHGKKAPAAHGSAVASLLVGQPGSEYAGLLPSAQLFAAEVFRRRHHTTETTTDALLAGLNWLLAQRVDIINLSLGGAYNKVLAKALQKIIAQGITVVAAAGNRGPDAPPVYPAAQPGVIAATAIDAAGRLYAQANRGDYIDFAAPGVDVWAANDKGGGQYYSGTSFAAPLVTAAVLLAQKSAPAGRKAIAFWAKNKARDLGPPGRDKQFGWGELPWSNPCP